MRFECWCAIERATSSRPCVRSTTVRNALESRAGVAAAIASAGKKAVVLRALALPRRVEGGRSIVVRGQASGVSRGLVTLTLQGFHRRRLVQRVRVITLENGTFRVSLRPRFSGRVHIVFAGDADPSIRDRERGHRSRASAARRARDRHARGRWLAGQSTCAWTAHPGWRADPSRLAGPSRTRRRLAAVLPQQRSDLGRDGTAAIDGVCHVSGLHSDNRYRLVVQGGADAVYLSAVSRGMVARPTG